MNPAARAVYERLTQARIALLKAQGELQLETEHLEEELGRVLEQIDILRGKVEMELCIMKDKEALRALS